MTENTCDEIKSKDPAYVIVAYHMECGCLRGREELVQGKSGLVCPKHPQFKIFRVVRECLSCSKIIRVKPRSIGTFRCPECSKAYRLFMNKRKNRKKDITDSQDRKIIRKKIFAAEKTGTCIFRSQCLEKMFKNKEKYLPCLTCNSMISITDAELGRFQPEEIKIRSLAL